MKRTEVTKTPWGRVRTPKFVKISGFAMILFSLFTVELGKYGSSIAFLGFLFEHFRAFEIIELNLLKPIMRFGVEVSVFGGIWLIIGRVGLTNEDRHYTMLLICLIISLAIIKVFNWEEGIINASIRTVLEGIDAIFTIIRLIIT